MWRASFHVLFKFFYEGEEGMMCLRYGLRYGLAFFVRVLWISRFLVLGFPIILSLRTRVFVQQAFRILPVACAITLDCPFIVRVLSISHLPALGFTIILLLRSLVFVLTSVPYLHQLCMTGIY